MGGVPDHRPAGGRAGLRRWLPAALAIGAAAGLVWLEQRRPLRRRYEPALPHTTRNLVVAGLSAATIRALEAPVVEPLARTVERRGWGVLPALALPRPMERILALVLLDYTLYWWHVATHRVPFLWNLHRVHHADRDLDASTAVRFHFAEMAMSVPYRAAQVALIGVRPADLALWQRLTLAEILFHHSNLRLPASLEAALGRLVVTPRMHGIHHSRRRAEMDSNWSSGLTLWDRLHGTLRRDVPQRSIPIGLAGCGARDVTLPRMLALPFRS